MLVAVKLNTVLLVSIYYPIPFLISPVVISLPLAYPVGFLHKTY